jgi:hypothetical protein
MHKICYLIPTLFIEAGNLNIAAITTALCCHIQITTTFTIMVGSYLHHIFMLQ